MRVFGGRKRNGGNDVRGKKININMDIYSNMHIMFIA